MKYCSNCGLIIESCDCPMCGYKNFRAKKPGEDSKEGPESPKPIFATVPPKPTMPVERQPVHKNCPKRSVHMLFGGLGSFMIAVSGIILGILPIYLMMQNDWMRFESFGIYLLFIFATILFMAGSGVLIGGLYGLFKHYGSYRGLVAMIFTLISPIILLIFTVIAVENSTYPSYYSSYDYYTIGPELWIGHMFVGIMFILIGMSWRNIYYKIGLDQPNIPVGSMFVAAGLLFMVFMGFTGLPWIMISIAGFSAGVLFFLGRSGTENIQDGRPKWRPQWVPVPDMPPPLPPPINQG